MNGLDYRFGEPQKLGKHSRLGIESTLNRILNNDSGIIPHVSYGENEGCVKLVGGFFVVFPKEIIPKEIPNNYTRYGQFLIDWLQKNAEYSTVEIVKDGVDFAQVHIFSVPNLEDITKPIIEYIRSRSAAVKKDDIP